MPNFVTDVCLADSRVEIDAKIHAGYWSKNKVVGDLDLSKTVGRQWDTDWDDVLH